MSRPKFDPNPPLVITEQQVLSYQIPITKIIESNTIKDLQELDWEPPRFSVGDRVSVYWDRAWKTGRVVSVGLTSPYLDHLMIDSLYQWFPFHLCRKEPDE